MSTPASEALARFLPLCADALASYALAHAFSPAVLEPFRAQLGVATAHELFRGGAAQHFFFARICMPVRIRMHDGICMGAHSQCMFAC